jgi:glycosyltransferase involved in cell wall biosynthesis
MPDTNYQSSMGFKYFCPLITIGITCFNAADTIERSIKSAQAQDWPNMEIVVLDDASSDNSTVIIEKLAQDDSRIRFVRHQTNKGYPGALNSILKTARGEFVAFFDDDDHSLADRLSKQWQRITEYENQHGIDLVLCYTNRRVVKADQDQASETVLAIGRQSPEPNGSVVSDFLLCHLQVEPFTWGQFGSCTMMARKEIFSKIGGFDEYFRRSAEWDLAIRMARLGGHFIAVDHPLVTQYKTHSSDKSGKTPLKYTLALRRKHKDLLKARGLYLASLALTYARFHYAKGNRIKERLFTALACLMSPRRILPSMLAQRKRARGAKL